MTAAELKLDYFKLYDVENVATRYGVTMRGQFDREPVSATLSVLDLFANPAAKNGEPLFDKRAHFNVYRLFQETQEPVRLVHFANQFGEADIRIGNAFAVLVPAWKREADLAFPKELSHYKVYWVVEPGKPVDRTVKLKDQFGTGEATVTMPNFFAVPVEKRYRRTVAPIMNEKAHLVIYRITPRTTQKQITVKDQFAERGLTVVRSLFLAAPSLKLRWKAEK